MEGKFKNYIDGFTREFVPVLGVVLAAMGIARLLEIAIVALQHGISMFSPGNLAAALVIDLQLVILISIPLSIVYYLLKGTRAFVRIMTVAIITGFLTAVSLLLSLYYSATLSPLGPEFWAYSVNEMTDTVIAAEGFIELKLVLFVLLTLLLIGAFYRVHKWVIGVQVSVRLGLMGTVVAIAGLGTILLWNQSAAPDRIASNKLSYFVTAGYERSTSEPAEYESIENSEYPFLKRTSEGDVIGPFFKEISEPPNIVFILIESLGGEFVGENSQWGGFAPFLDSLAANGLYWENGLSMSGRTFGMIPSLLGSLPPGRHGFMELGPDYPVHTSIIRMLDDQGYHTSFYSGYNTYFDGLNYFLDYQGTDVIVSKEWISNRFSKQFEAGSNYWGYDDKTLFDIATLAADTINPEPRLEIYHTLQTHSPFTVPNDREYARKFDDRLNNLPVSSSQKENFKRYRSELTTLLFTDDALRDFMNDYKERESYSNTLFVITGDHWLIPVPQTSRISRYHVPIIFYSELIKEPVRFESVNTHANVVPALTTFLKKSANLSLPDSVHWIGESMDTTRTFRNIHSLPLMQNKNQISDYINGNYFLNDNILFEINNGLNLTQISDPDRKYDMAQMLAQFKSENAYATQNDKLYPDRYKKRSVDRYDFITQYASMFERIDSTGLSVDEQFMKAREYAFDGEYDRSRAISKRLLLESPNYHDVRILMARTHAWNREYDEARKHLSEVIRRDEAYYDTYNALFDTEYWTGNYSTALSVINAGLIHHPQNEGFLQKKIRVLLKLNRKNEAKETLAEFKNHHPSHEKINELEEQLF